MVANPSRLSAQEVHQRLCAALSDLERAQRKAVLWFAEVVRRKLYRERGHSSIYQYAELELGFKKSKTAQFLRLSESLRELPSLRRSVARGELSWTKAREVAKVATLQTESHWIREAKKVSSRELESRVRSTRRQAMEAASPSRSQISLIESAVGKGSATLEISDTRAMPDTPEAIAASPQSVPMSVNLRMSAEQYARYQALLEAIRKGGARGDQIELLLAGLEQLALNRKEATQADTTQPDSNQGRSGSNGVPADREPCTPAGEGREFTRVNSRSPYQVIVQQCPDCSSGRVSTPCGEKELTPQELRTILCDGNRRPSGERNQASVPPRLRREVLERDRFRCQAAGCGGTSFLAVHHLVPRERGGANTRENLITLCSGCHRALHEGGTTPGTVSMTGDATASDSGRPS